MVTQQKHGDWRSFELVLLLLLVQSLFRLHLQIIHLLHNVDLIQQQQFLVHQLLVRRNSHGDTVLRAE